MACRSTTTRDYPASSPNVLACGGTNLTIDAHGDRSAEVTWDDDDRSSATGGGDSVFFPGRAVPDVAGSASPSHGWTISVNGELQTIGGTSAVAPLYAALYVLLLEANGGKPFDFLNTVLTNPDVCFDVTAGDNGAFRAGPGRDKTTGFGVVDGRRMLAKLTGSNQVPAPAPVAPVPAPVTPPDTSPYQAIGAVLDRMEADIATIRAMVVS